MNTDVNKEENENLLYKDLTFEIRGAIFDVSNLYGKGFKESIYLNALLEQFTKRKIKFETQKRVKVFSLDTGKVLGYYIPDVIVEEKIVLELKATEFTNKFNFEQELSYLKASKYEVGILVNFNTPKLFIKRFLYTNNRKIFLKEK